MERVTFDKLNNIGKGLRTNSFVIASGTIDKVFNLENGDYDILIKDLNKDQKIVINILEGSTAKISFFANNELNNLDVDVNCYRNSEANIWFADFSKDKNVVNVSIYINAVKREIMHRLALNVLNQYSIL